ncbi:MAG: hypothetical protein P8J33_14420 [Pirellulaceae bacterium]|nr:hypothetical protein [Pirellulaceae bacterium]
MDLAEAVRNVIRDRKTEKILADPQNPVEYTAEQLNSGDQIVKQAIRDSGWAPFHYDRRQDGLAEPWRAWWLNQTNCQKLAEKLPQLIPDLKPGNKMPGLLSGCGSLTLFTWLPQPNETGPESSKRERINREHLAATAAAVQNFLLLLTAEGIRNYWASGSLIQDYLFDTLKIPHEQVLAAAVFTHYPDPLTPVEVIAGKHRERRSPNTAWLQDVLIDP